MQRNILHLRFDAFPVAVERLKNSALRDKPVVICSRHSPRSPVFSASPEARSEGVFDGLPLNLALKHCRRLIVLSPDDSLYQRAGRAVAGILTQYSPLVETGTRPGRFFVDMSGTARLFGGLQDTAWRIRQAVRESVRLNGTLGVGSNKLVSGIAARIAIRHSDLCSVPWGSESSFLAPLRVGMLPAVASKTEKTLLSEFNIRWNRQLVSISLPQLAAVFGRLGPVLQRQALGIDNAPVLRPGAKPFILEETALQEDSNDDQVLLGCLYTLTERACARMRAQNAVPHTVWIHLRYADSVDVTRLMKLRSPTVVDPLLFRLLEPFYLKTSFRRQRVRSMSLTFTDLEYAPAQLALFEPETAHQRESRLISALDCLRQKYGETAVQFGRTTFHPNLSGAPEGFIP